VLRGALGATLALPFLPSLSAPRVDAAPPLRFLFCTGGFSLGTNLGVEPDGLLAMVGTGAGYTMSETMAPLERVRDLFTAVSGLRIPMAGADGVVPVAGRVAGDARFHGHMNPLVAGIRQQEACEVCVTGPTPDQVVADAFAASGAAPTPFRSLALRVQADGYTPSTVPAYGVLSYRRAGEKAVAVPPIVSPRLAWMTLTGGGAATDARLYQLEQRRSVLDLVDRRGSALLSRLGAEDRERLERHFSEVRDLELRLASNAPPPPGCTPIPSFSEDPAGGDSYYYTDESLRARLMHDLIHHALVCDLTRSLSLMYTFWKTEIGTRAWADFDWTAHETHHHGDNTQLRQILAWHLDLWADLLERLASTPEGDGTLLDRCAVVYQSEGGIGPTTSIDRSHSTEQMVSFVAGRAGGLSPGRHIISPDRHPSEVFITAMQAVGVDVDAHGEVVGGVPELLG
jgi:hypothetical protein